MIDERLMTLLVQHTGKPREEITLDADLDDLGIDSLGLFEIEDEFNIDFGGDSEIADLRTVQDLVGLMAKAGAA